MILLSERGAALEEIIKTCDSFREEQRLQTEQIEQLEADLQAQKQQKVCFLLLHAFCSNCSSGN